MSYNATLIGSPSFIAATPGFGQALSLASGQGANLPVPGPFDFPTRADFTIEARAAGSSGVLFARQGNGGQAFYVYNGSCYFGAGTINAVTSIVSGVHTYALTYEVATTTFRYFIDGALQGSLVSDYFSGYNTQAAIGTTAASGDACIGALSHTGQATWQGTIEEFRVSDSCLYTTAYTPATAPFANSTVGTVALYHFDGDSLDAAPNRPWAVFDGDSLTYSQYGSSGGLVTGASYPAACLDLIGRANFRGANIGVPGQRIDQMQSDAAGQVDTLYTPGARLYFEPSGINDSNNGASLETINARTLVYIQARKAAGWNLYVLTPQGVNNPDLVQHAQWIRDNAATYGYTVVDVAANPLLNDPSNTTYRQSDGVHFTDAGYELQGQLAGSAKIVVNVTVSTLHTGGFSF